MAYDIAFTINLNDTIPLFNWQLGIMYYYQNTTPILFFTIKNGDTPYVLPTGAVVNFYVKRNTSETLYVVNQACTVISASLGQVQIQLPKMPDKVPYVAELRLVDSNHEITLKRFIIYTVDNVL